jgi:hypothetical protein
VPCHFLRVADGQDRRSSSPIRLFSSLRASRRWYPPAREIATGVPDRIDSYLRAGEQGDWRALDALVNRVYGKATEHIVTEAAKPQWKVDMDKLSLEELEELINRQRAEHLRAVEDEVLRRTIEDEEAPRTPLRTS